MRKKFKIYYSTDNCKNPDKAGTKYKPSNNEMLVMNNSGIFFIFNSADYYPSIMPLVEKIGNYDVVWND